MMQSFLSRGINSVFRCSRFLSTSNFQCSDEKWFGKIFGQTEVGKPTHSHASTLSDTEDVYDLHIHSVKPDRMDEYIVNLQKICALVSDKNTGAELVGSFTSEIGAQDECLHLFKYRGGYAKFHEATMRYRTDPDFLSLRKERTRYLRSRKNTVMLKFSFWPEPQPREGPSMYELRSYTLKPGTMFEWGNNWARGIAHRNFDNEAVCGWFAQIGQLYTVNHLWCYKDLQHRKMARATAWTRPGWDENVAYTVPLIREMESRILLPTAVSPLK